MSARAQVSVPWSNSSTCSGVPVAAPVQVPSVVPLGSSDVTQSSAPPADGSGVKLADKARASPGATTAGNGTPGVAA